MPELSGDPDTRERANTVVENTIRLITRACNALMPRRRQWKG